MRRTRTSLERSHRPATRLETTSCSPFRTYRDSRSRPLQEPLPMPTHALPSTAFRSCRNKLNSALRMPLFFPVLDKIKGSIPHSRIPYGLCGKFMVAASFFLLLALGLGAQDLKLKVAAYMKAQVEVNHFKGEILIAQKGMVLVRDQYGPVTGVSEEPTRNNKYPLGSIA